MKISEKKTVPSNSSTFQMINFPAVYCVLSVLFNFISTIDVTIGGILSEIKMYIICRKDHKF